MGVAPQKRRLKKSIKKNNDHVPSSTSFTVNFLEPVKTWLLLPHSGMNPYQLLILNKNFQTIEETFDSLDFFKNKYSKNSFQFSIAQTIYRSRLSHSEVDSSIRKADALNRYVRYQFKRLLIAYLHRKLKVVNTEDIVTMEPIQNPIRIYNLSARKVYMCEAKSFINDSIVRLLYNTDLFLQAKMPRNLLTNEILKYSDLVFIHEQLRFHGITHWLWECFAASDFNIPLLLRNYQIPIQTHILKNLLRIGEDAFARDLLVDFILSEYEHHDCITSPSESVLYKILEHSWKKHPLINRWISECYTLWDLQLRKVTDLNKYIANIHKRTKKLIDRHSEIITHWKNITKK